MPSPKVITFDFYGTLVQWHQALDAAGHAILSRHTSPQCDVQRLMNSFASVGRALRDTPPMRNYRDVLRMSLAAAKAQYLLSYDASDDQILLSHILKIPPFPEAPNILAQLQSKYRIGVISNTDDDIIAGSLETLGISPDYVITAQQAGAYKPNLRLFQYAHARIGVSPDEVVHVAASQELDMSVCKTMGIRSIWVNRRGERKDNRWDPVWVVADLANLPEKIDNL
jgi:2-haloacid dehalogenase